MTNLSTARARRSIVLTALSMVLLTSPATSDAACHSLLSKADGDKLILLTPEAQKAAKSGLLPSLHPSGRLSWASPHPSYTRLLTGDRGGVLDNGILDYFTVDRITGQVYDVNGMIVDSPTMASARAGMTARCSGKGGAS